MVAFRIATAVCGACLLLAGGSSTSLAKKASRTSVKQTERVRALDHRVRAEVERALPKGLSIASMSVPESLHKRASKRDIVSLHWRSSPAVGRVIVQVLVHKKSGRIKKGWARIELVQHKRVLVAATSLPAGTILRASDLRIEERPMIDGGELAFEPNYLLGSRVIAAINAGDSLIAKNVSMPMPIARGTPVRVEVRRGGVVVATRGVLETKTKVGFTTRVRVSGRLMTGRLVRADTVLLTSLSLAGVR